MPYADAGVEVFSNCLLQRGLPYESIRGVQTSSERITRLGPLRDRCEWEKELEGSGGRGAGSYSL